MKFYLPEDYDIDDPGIREILHNRSRIGEMCKKFMEDVIAEQRRPNLCTVLLASICDCPYHRHYIIEHCETDMNVIVCFIHLATMLSKLPIAKKIYKHILTEYKGMGVSKAYPPALRLSFMAYPLDKPMQMYGGTVTDLTLHDIGNLAIFDSALREKYIKAITPDKQRTIYQL